METGDLDYVPHHVDHPLVPSGAPFLLCQALEPAEIYVAEVCSTHGRCRLAIQTPYELRFGCGEDWGVWHPSAAQSFNVSGGFSRLWLAPRSGRLALSVVRRALEGSIPRTEKPY